MPSTPPSLPPSPGSPRLRALLSAGRYEEVFDLLSPAVSRSVTTRKNVLSGWRKLAAWLSAEGHSLTNVPDPPAFAAAYAAWLGQDYRGVAASVNNRLVQARRLYALLIERGLTDVNPFDGQRGEHHEPAPRRPVYSPEDVARLLEKAGPEDRALLLLGAHAGLSGPEVRALRWEDLALEGLEPGQPAQVHLKTRTVPASPALAAALRELSRRRGEAPLYGQQPGGLLFPHGEDGSAMSDNALRSRVFRLCAAAGVTYKAWHPLRHAAGLRFLEGGRRPAEVQALLGLAGPQGLMPLQQLRRGGKKRDAAGQTKVPSMKK